MDVGETIGKGIGVLLAPLAALGSFLRGARFFHAQGVVYRASARADATEGTLGTLAHDLAGPAIVRLSSGGGGVLGVAVRFGTGPVAVPAKGARVQDLILLSVPHLWQVLIAARLTDASDFLANTYYTIARSRVEGLGLVELRLVPHETGVAAQPISERAVHHLGALPSVGAERRERLEAAVAAGTAVMQLELRRVARGAGWRQVATIKLLERVDLDQEALRFNPYHAGLGIEPAGFLQGLRWALYPASQIGRDLRHRLAALGSRKR